MRRLFPLVVLLGCGDGGGAGDDDATPDAAPPRVYGGDRPVELQVPDLSDGEDKPLVMLLHGYGATGLLQTAYLQLADVPADHGAFFLAPDGTRDSTGRLFWAATDACCGENPPEVDDVAYLGGLIDAISADWPVDPERVFVIGHSNGHFMAYRLACERADVIAGIAGLAGAANSLDGSGCDPVMPVSSLHVHGDADDVVLYEGGTFVGGSYPGAIDSTMQWAAHDGCGTTRTTGTPVDVDRQLAGDETIVEVVDGCPAPVGVELWTIQGGSHIPNFVDGFGSRLVDWLVAHSR